MAAASRRPSSSASPSRTVAAVTSGREPSGRCPGSRGRCLGHPSCDGANDRLWPATGPGAPTASRWRVLSRGHDGRYRRHEQWGGGDHDGAGSRTRCTASVISVPTSWSAGQTRRRTGFARTAPARSGRRSVRMLTVVHAGGFARHPCSRRLRAGREAVAMLVRRNGRGPQRNRRLMSWPRWVQAWREDREQHAAARAEARALAPVRPGERLLAVARGAGGELSAATGRALYHQASQAWVRLGWDQVGRADWDEQRHVLTLSGLTPAVPARTVLPLARDWTCPRWPPSVSAGPAWLTSGSHSTGRPGPAWSPGVSLAECGSGGWSSSTAGSIPGTL
jgi:hypothetical protein